MDKISKAKNLDELKSEISVDRREFLTRFLERKWFKNTDFELQKEILTLPDDWDGYLSDLVKRKDEIRGLEIIKLSSFQRGDFMAFTRFLVRVLHTNQEINYREYVSYKYGNNPGYKGILLLEEDNQIKYFVIKKAEKFPIGELEYDSFGEMIQFRQGELINLPKNAEKEIKRQLGIDKIEIKKFIDLGQMYPDVGKTNLHFSLFAAVIDISKNADDIKKLKDKLITNTKMISFELLIEPVEKLHEYIYKVDDSYFLACILRLVSIGVIKLG